MEVSLSLDKYTWTELLHAAVEQFIAFDGTFEGDKSVVDTPDRVVRAWQEMTNGQVLDPTIYLQRSFEDPVGNYDEMVTVENIPILSTCKHHLLPIIGRATFAYIPDGKFVGLSKIPRYIEILAKRLQVQEELTQKIVDVFQDTVKPKGCAVYLRCLHCCMSTRGVKAPNAITSTTALRKCFSNGSTKQEFLLSLNRQGGVL